LLKFGSYLIKKIYSKWKIGTFVLNFVLNRPRWMDYSKPTHLSLLFRNPSTAHMPKSFCPFFFVFCFFIRFFFYFNLLQLNFYWFFLYIENYNFFILLKNLTRKTFIKHVLDLLVTFFKQFVFSPPFPDLIWIFQNTQVIANKDLGAKKWKSRWH